MVYHNIEFEQSGVCASITLNRPDQLNPIDMDTLIELNSAFDDFDSRQDAEILVLRGNGRAFSAGGDIKRYAQIHRDAALMRRLSGLAATLVEKIERSEKLVVAVVTGLCLAGGFELILACDFIIATEDAAFSDGHLNLSLLPGAGGTQRLPRLLGPLRAKDLMLTARFITGREALEIGLVTYCWPSAELPERLDAILETLRQKSFSSRRAIKYLVNQGLRGPLEAGVQMERIYAEHYMTTHPDPHEGIVAFIEKRKPDFAPHSS